MGARSRPADAGSDRARRLLADAGRELREARRDRDLSLATVARASGISVSAVSRLERGQARKGSVLAMARVGHALGLDLVVKFYPGGQPVRDAAHLQLLAAFRDRLHPSIAMRSEVALDVPGDQRAWDAVIGSRGWSYGVEAETGPTDVQAVLRRLNLKVRDAGVGGVILLLSGTAQSQRFLAAGRTALAPEFPVTSDAALGHLAAGRDPGGNAIVVLPRRDRRITARGGGAPSHAAPRNVP